MNEDQPSGEQREDEPKRRRKANVKARYRIDGAHGPELISIPKGHGPVTSSNQ